MVEHEQSGLSLLDSEEDNVVRSLPELCDPVCSEILELEESLNRSRLVGVNLYLGFWVGCHVATLMHCH